MRSPRILVLLAAYNGDRWLDEQIHSILNQCRVDVSLFISIDPGTDNTETLCREWADRDHRVRVLPSSDSFGCAAKNFYHLLRQVDLTQVDYVSLADQDDLWEPDKLLCACKILQQGYSGYSSNVTAFWPDGRRFLIDKAQPQREFDYLFEAAGPGCTYVLDRNLASALQQDITRRRDDVEAIYFHDWFFYAYARSGGYRWFIDSHSGLLYRQHAHNHTGVHQGFRASVKRLRMIVSHQYRFETLRIAQLCQDCHPTFSVPFRLRAEDCRRFILIGINGCRRSLRDRIALFALALLRLF
ncbi:glycosyltransferase [uncultured Desulfuromonas sp.]|uniref:glycosyltransferase n=1 Tax=uncultured Desulfuromonas sp. TaxID=181013 RepID=UPI002AAB474D|nr:glycosyltransferase [uncultured Desulfuromonas sp.]